MRGWTLEKVILRRGREGVLFCKMVEAIERALRECFDRGGRRNFVLKCLGIIYVSEDNREASRLIRKSLKL